MYLCLCRSFIRRTANSAVCVVGVAVITAVIVVAVVVAIAITVTVAAVAVVSVLGGYFGYDLSQWRVVGSAHMQTVGAYSCW